MAEGMSLYLEKKFRLVGKATFTSQKMKKYLIKNFFFLRSASADYENS